jgi:hypothetical protein
MKKIILALAATAAIAAAMPAAAQTYGQDDGRGRDRGSEQYDRQRGDDRGYNGGVIQSRDPATREIDAQRSQLGQRIARAVARGAVNNNEARQLRRRLANIEITERQWTAQGRIMNRRQINMLRVKLDQLSRDLRNLTNHGGRPNY